MYQANISLGESNLQQSQTLFASVEETAFALIDNNISHWFEIIEEDGLTLQSQITDNYIENNTAIQDHVAQSPIMITLTGYIGETVFYPPKNFWNNTVTYADNYTSNKLGITVTDKLGPLTALLPSVSNVTHAARNAVLYAEASVERYKNIYEQVKSLKKKAQKNPTETSQQYIANKLKQLWEARTMVEVLTPWGKYENMQILSISFRQGNTNTTTNLSVTLKQIKYASTQTTQPNRKVMSEYNAIQRAELANHGKAQGVNVDNSILYNSKWKGSAYKTHKSSKNL